MNLSARLSRSARFAGAAFFLATAVYAAWPRPQGRVSDFAGAFSPDQRAGLEAFLDELQRRTGDEVAVAVLDSLNGQDIDSAANEIFSQWGVGQKGKDNGVLIVCSPADRRARIEVGYGLEGVLPDGLCGRILDERMVPFFKAGDYAEGLRSGAAAVAAVLARQAGADLPGFDVRKPPATGRNDKYDVFYTLAFVIVIMLINAFVNRRRRGFYGGGIWYGGGFGGGSSGGSGGGFGGFGGGMSGGGGAGRSW